LKANRKYILKKQDNLEKVKKKSIPPVLFLFLKNTLIISMQVYEKKNIRTSHHPSIVTFFEGM
jgi:hypothetical protein